MPTLKLTYFDGRGAAECCRLLFKAGGVEFEDCRLGWDDMKAKKAAGEFKVNLDKLPILSIDGVEVGQSKTIERYAAKAGGLAGASEIETALIDAILEHKRDVRDSWGKVDGMPKSEEKDAACQKWLDEDLPKWLGQIEKALPAGEPFLVGSTITHADIGWFQLMCERTPLGSEAERSAPRPRRLTRPPDSRCAHR
jgi:glutathione S-transferase